VNGKYAQLEALYAEVPDIDCCGQCHTTCGALLPMSAAERLRTGLQVRGSDPDCAALTVSNRCAIHNMRPLICRLYGVAEGLECDYGCQPERYLSKAEAYALIHRAKKISDG